MSNLFAVSVDILDCTIFSEIRADKLKVRHRATTESSYSIAERLIEELDAEAKHMRSLGLFG